MDLRYCICGCNTIHLRGRLEICIACGKQKMPVSPGQKILTRHISKSQRTTNLESKKDER